MECSGYHQVKAVEKHETLVSNAQSIRSDDTDIGVTYIYRVSTAFSSSIS